MGWGDIGTDAVLRGAGDAALTGIDDLAWGGEAGAPVLFASTGAGGALSSWSPGPSGLVAVDRAGLAPTARAGIGGEVVLMPGPAPMVATTGVAGAGLTAFALGSGGDIGPPSSLSPTGGALPTDLSNALCVAVAGDTFLYGLRLGSERVSAWEVGPGGALTTLSDPTPSQPSSAGAPLADLAAVARGGSTFLLGASSSGDALVCWRIAANGVPVETARAGAAQGIGVDAPAAVAAVTLGERAFAVMASAGSGTLTVAEVRADGTLQVTDHLLDDLGTRFAGASQVAACEANDRAFVAAAGRDGGVSLFELLPSGRLVLLSTVEDTGATTLSGLSALALTASGGMLRIAVASGSEPGITLLKAPLPSGGVARGGTGEADALAGTAGDDRLDGAAGDDAVTSGAGDDLLVDGAGVDRLTGGSGEDLFVLSADADADTVADFQVGLDRIDLSGWTGLRSTGQLAVRSTADGAEITFGAETLRLVTANGAPLTVEAVRAMPLVGVTRMLPTPFAGEPRTLTGGTGADTLTGGEGPDRITGGGGDDSLDGAQGADLLYGGEGLDRMRGNDGDDTLWGGAGADELWLSAGRDRAYGEDGDDRAWCGTGDDSVWGGMGRDTLWGEAGLDRLQGDDGDDALYGGDGDDSLRGDAGLDRLWGDAGTDSLSGGDGDDSLLGGSGNDRLAGDAALDRLDGGSGTDTLWGGEGNDSLLGGEGADLLQGEGGTDSLGGWLGDDSLVGGDGNDRLAGEGDRDRLDGGNGNDLLWGGEGDDTLRGDDGNDQLQGEAGNDRLEGGTGTDHLMGQGGADLMLGGSGADSFVFSSGRDRVADFADNVDTLFIDDALWGGGTRTAQQMLGFARVVNGDVVFTFASGATLTVENVASTGLLLNDLAVG